MALFCTSHSDSISKRLGGNVILATPVSVKLYSACCISVLAASALFLCLATYTRHETVLGWLVPHGGLIQVGANARGYGPVASFSPCRTEKQEDLVQASMGEPQITREPSIALSRYHKY